MRSRCGNKTYHPIFCLDSGGARGVSPFFASESGTFATKTVVPPASARVQSGVPSCPRAPPWLFVVALQPKTKLSNFYQHLHAGVLEYYPILPRFSSCALYFVRSVLYLQKHSEAQKRI